MSKSAARELYDVSQAADFLRIKKDTMEQLAQSGKIPGIRVSGQWLFPKAVLEEHSSPPRNNHPDQR